MYIYNDNSVKSVDVNQGNFCRLCLKEKLLQVLYGSFHYKII